MPLPEDKAWFPAKKFGIGWAVPDTWQGWVVILTYAVSCFTGVFLFGERLAVYLPVYLFVMTMALLAMMWWKGARSRWRGLR